MLLFSACNSKERHFPSPDGKHWLTVYEQTDNTGKSYTCITYGKHKEAEHLNCHVRVRNRYSDAWYCLLSWERGKAVLYAPYDNFEVGVGNMDGKIEIRKMRDKEFSELFFSREKNQYVRLSSYDKNNLW